MTELLSKELAGRGRTLEVGVGTGQVALPLHHAGVAVVGLDLARSMMDRLIHKAGGRAPFPLVHGDATRMPFVDGSFGAAYLRWVLHLIPDWSTALREVARVVRPSGVLLVLAGGYGGIRSEIQERFAELAGVSVSPPGLMWSGYDDLDEAMAALGASVRRLPSYVEPGRDSLEHFMDGIVRNRYSWTWKVKDPMALARLVDDVRSWTEERYGPLDRYTEEPFEIVWRAYDLPA